MLGRLNCRISINQFCHPKRGTIRPLAWTSRVDGVRKGSERAESIPTCLLVICWHGTWDRKRPDLLGGKRGLDKE